MVRMMRALAVVVSGLFAIGAWQAQSTVQSADWQSLFDGKTLNGWQPSERPESWKIEDGAIVTSGDRSHLFYLGPVAHHTFKNFEFSAEVMATPGSNSGISGRPTTTDARARPRRDRGRDASMTWAESLAANHTDGILILDRGIAYVHRRHRAAARTGPGHENQNKAFRPN